MHECGFSTGPWRKTKQKKIREAPAIRTLPGTGRSLGIDKPYKSYCHPTFNRASLILVRSAFPKFDIVLLFKSHSAIRISTPWRLIDCGKALT